MASRKISGTVNCFQCIVALVIACMAAACGNRVDFNSQVKPILNKKCISCHGGVKKNGGFSLLFRHEAVDTTESGAPAIIPFHPEKSEMIRRLTATDPEERMPYKEEPLTEAEIEILTKWIDEGAEWGVHWAYTPPQSAGPVEEMFSGQENPFIQNPVDYFVLEKLGKEKLQPSPQADPSTLLRRVSLDLTGLPPSAEDTRLFFKDPSPEGYRKLVDRLLQSPAFGEKWASWWLDMARYADTKGYERDVGRTIWRYRDWVIKAFNTDMPFDQFTIEQLAGDMLPGRTDDNLIATAFHRNTMNNDEGGTEDEEFRVAAMIDRVNTTWEIWQSTTFACVQCHSHPYDPFIHEDYYKSLAIFNNTRDEDTEGEHPKLRLFKAEDARKINEIVLWIKQLDSKERADKTLTFLKTFEPKYHPHDLDSFVNGELIDTKWLGIWHSGSARLRNVNLTGKTELFFSYFTRHTGGRIEVRAGSVNGELITSGALVRTENSRRVVRLPVKPTQGVHDLYFLFSNPSIKPQQPVCDLEWLAFLPPLPESADKAAMEITFLELLNADTENHPVMIENEPERYRDTHIFERGNWLVKGKKITPGVPEFLQTTTNPNPSNRLEFARWLVDPENPLTSRSIVNRVWEQFFGTGIAETLEDLGTQGALPSHPELLDWLAVNFSKDQQWRFKELIRTIVLSGTYQQDSRVTEELLQLDPANRLLARGPRVRLSAEQVRDQALAVSGLLSTKMYGKPVMPYQPAGIWNSVWSGEYWKQSEGEDLYRRSIYTYIKRTSPYPAFMMFDGSSREFCVSRRIRTNTPLQALVTMNDSTYIVAARSLALRMSSEHADDVKSQIRSGYRQMLARDINEPKLEILLTLYNRALVRYRERCELMEEILAGRNGSPELAALTIVGQAMLNLDEVLTKE